MEGSTVSTGGDHSGARIGCSGWVYRHWRGLFYPEGLPQKRWFEHYAAQFDTVEINASFYRLPLASTFEGWREKAPPGFRYAVKVNRFITHMKKLRRLRGGSRPLHRACPAAPGQALGPLLYQLPPSLHRTWPAWTLFLGRLPDDLMHVVEFRHASWYDEEVLALLDRHNVGFVVHDLRGLVSPRWASGNLAYVRFHGTSGRYHGLYGRRCSRVGPTGADPSATRGRNVWCYFNNDIHGHALEDARNLKEMLAE